MTLQIDNYTEFKNRHTNTIVGITLLHYSGNNVIFLLTIY